MSDNYPKFIPIAGNTFDPDPEDAKVLKDMRDTIERAFRQTVELHEEKRTAIIKQRVHELGINIDYEAEARKRFKSFALVSGVDEETIYYNDGSDEGLRVITFVTRHIPFDPKEMKAGIETTYY